MQDKPQTQPVEVPVEKIDLRHLDRIVATSGIGCCGRSAGHACCGRHHRPSPDQTTPTAAPTDE